MQESLQEITLKRALSHSSTSDSDPIIESAKLMIASAAEFVPLERIEENRCINTVYTDPTIVELALFYLFQLDLYLFAKKDEHREKKIRKIIQHYVFVFHTIIPGFNYEELIYNRIELYGNMANHNKNFMTDTLKLLKEVIIDTNRNMKYRIALRFSYSDDFHLAARLEYHLTVYFDRHQKNLINIYKAVREVDQIQELS
jgi:hypothetical protein